MTIEEEIAGEFGHLNVSAAVSLAQVDAAEKDLQEVPDAVVTATCAAVGVQVKNKREGAYVVAAIREAIKVAGEFAPLVMAL